MNYPIDGARPTNILSYPDPEAFKMPYKFFRRKSLDYDLMLDRYNRLNNKPRCNGEIIPVGVEYGNIIEPTAEW